MGSYVVRVTVDHMFFTQNHGWWKKGEVFTIPKTGEFVASFQVGMIPRYFLSIGDRVEGSYNSSYFDVTEIR